MMFKSSGRIVLFTLLCSMIGTPSATLRADVAQDCAKAKKIAQRVHASICAFFSSGDPKQVVNGLTYLNNLNPSEGVVRKLLAKMKASLTALLEKMRSAKRKQGAHRTDIEPCLTQAFDKFGSDVRNAACEVEAMGDDAEIQELAALLNKMPAIVNREFLKINGIRKKKLGINVWLGRF